MKTVEDKEKFIELRAGGMSFTKIAEQIGVSKPTLIKRNIEFSKEIENKRFLVVEELLEQYRLMQTTRIQIFGEVLSRALEELQHRDFGLLSMRDLLALINLLEGKLMREGGMLRYTTDQQVSYLESLELGSIPIKIGLFDQK